MITDAYRRDGRPIRRVAWVTDPHLNFLSGPQVLGFLDSLSAVNPDAVLLGGDTGEADCLPLYLRRMESRLRIPVYLVLGNHDFYHGSIDGVRQETARVVGGSASLYWLSRLGPVELAPEVGLVGHDGWADGGYGDYEGSGVELNDFRLIAEFRGRDRQGRLSVMRRLAEETATHFARVVPEALDRFRHVLVLTHVPPFREATWHKGKISDPFYLPYFSSKVAGDVLLEAMRARPDRKMLVLCGHTHSEGVARVLPNLTVITGGAEYGQPRIQMILDLGEIEELWGAGSPDGSRSEG